MGKKYYKWQAEDGLAHICNICYRFGELLTCGVCSRSFHLHCLGLSVAPEEDVWCCSVCTPGKVFCFACNCSADIDSEAVHCAVPQCAKYYHQNCIMKLEDDRLSACREKKPWGLSAGPSGSTVCPHHTCDTCRGGRDGQKELLLRCILCPTTYHTGCMPYPYRLLDGFDYNFLCWRHITDWKSQQLSLPVAPTADVSEVFRRLQTPFVHEDFTIGKSFIESVKRISQKASSQPPPYVHIKRNVYVDNEVRAKKAKGRGRADDRDDHDRCNCSHDDDKPCGNSCLCAMLYSTCSKSCPCGDRCSNIAFQKRKRTKIVPVQTEKCGWGAVAGEDISNGDFVIEYVGEVINDDTCSERLWDQKERGENNFYLVEINKEMVIDASFKGNVSRLINHSCEPNCEMQKWQIEGETRIGLFALQDIPKGATLSYDYSFVPFGVGQDCHCGAAECRGTLGAKPKKARRLVDTIADALKPKAVTTLAPNQLTTKKGKPVPGPGYSFIAIDETFKKTKRRSLGEQKHTVEGAAKCKECKRFTSLVGKRVKIWWPLDQLYYRGTVQGYSTETHMSLVLYDDDQTEEVRLSKENWDVDDPVSLKMPHRMAVRDARSSLLEPEEGTLAVPDSGGEMISKTIRLWCKAQHRFRTARVEAYDNPSSFYKVTYKEGGEQGLVDLSDGRWRPAKVTMEIPIRPAWEGTVALNGTQTIPDEVLT